MVLTGVAYTGIECLERDLVRSIHPVNELQTAALELAIQLAQKDRYTYCHLGMASERRWPHTPHAWA